MTTRTESYWAERNALVDAVKAIDPRIDSHNVFTVDGWNLTGAAELRAEYTAALEALKAFDAAHDAAPIL